MSNSIIKVDGSLFSYSSADQSGKQLKLKELDQKVDAIIWKTIEKLEGDKVQASEIERIEISQTGITYYAHQAQYSYLLESEFTKEISRLANQVLVIHRDRVGEKILSSAAAGKFANLYLYSSGGGGHKTAKEAEMERDLVEFMEHVKTDMIDSEKGVLAVETEMSEEELMKGRRLITDERLKDSAKFIDWCKQMGIVKDVDVLHDYLGKVGKWATDQWDTAQASGDVIKQEQLATKQWLSDLFFGPIIFFSTLRSLIQFKPKKIVSTQAQATPSILLAIKLYNLFYKPEAEADVRLALYMTDLPTEYAIHFFDSLKRVTEMGGKGLIDLYVPELDSGTDWETLCGLPAHQVKELNVKDLPVRREFLKAIDEYRPDLENPSINLKVSDSTELALLNEVLSHQSKTAVVMGDQKQKGAQELTYRMDKQDKGTFIMLGSQPTRSAIEGYVQEYLQLARENPQTVYHVFPFAGKYEKEKECFYKQLSESLQKEPNWPSNLHIVPLSFQTPKQLVSLAMGCDTVTRSGGATAMELLVMNEIYKKFPNLPKRERYIHAQQVEGRDLVRSIALWERGNFFTLEKKVGAKVIDPKSFRSVIK